MSHLTCRAMSSSAVKDDDVAGWWPLSAASIAAACCLARRSVHIMSMSCSIVGVITLGEPFDGFSASSFGSSSAVVNMCFMM